MNLIKRVRTLRVFWPKLKGCVAFSLLMLHHLPRHPKPSGLRMRVITWHMDEQQLATYMLVHIDCMVAKGQLDLKVATRLVAEELSRLMTKQQMEEKETVGLEAIIKAAGMLPAGPPEEEGG